MPIITQPEIQALIYDPNRIQQLLLKNTGINQINDPTNPFVMLIEAAATLSAATAAETTAATKRIFPSLATNSMELTPHLTEVDLPNLFSYPSEANLVFYINLMDMRNFGVRPTNQNYVETYIPINTSISVAGVPFLLSNDILVRLYDNGVVFAEQQHSSEYGSNNGLGILAAGIVNFQDGVSWIAVESVFKQLNKSEIIKPVTASEGFLLDVTHKDNYNFTEAYYRNASTNNLWVNIRVSHSDVYIDPSIPTLSVNVAEKLVRYVVPDVYLVSGQISGEIKIVLYETVGKLELPIYKYQMSEYAVTLGKSTGSLTAAAITNMTVYANSRDTINGGTSGYTFQELKNSVIHNTLGHVNMPITFSQLKRTAHVSGFDLYPAVDVLTGRLYIASNNISRSTSDLIYTKPDIYFNTVSIDGVMLNDPSIINNQTNAVIPSGTLFRTDNGITTIVSSQEVARIKGLPNSDIITYLMLNDIYYSLYYYVLDLQNTNTGVAKVYDLDTPLLNNIKIVAKNVSVVERVNVGQYGLYKTDTGYQLLFTVIGNTEFKNSNANALKGQLSISLYNNADKVHFTGTYDTQTELMTFNLDTRANVTIDNKMVFTNGISQLTAPAVDLSTSVTIYLYTEDSTIVDNTNYLVNELVVPTTKPTVLDKETIDVEFGKAVDTIWNKEYTTYTDRQYKKHTADKPLVYKHDVYARDPATGSIITVKAVAGVNTATKTLLHAAGSPVLDANGAPVLEYKAGDIVLDTNGVPITDNIYGAIQHVDILMLEYKYLVASGVVATNYRTSIKDTVDGWLFNSLVALNKKVLENTKVLYRSYKKSMPIDVIINSAVTKIPYTAKPQVDIYSATNTYTGAQLSNMSTSIGYIIHKHLDMPVINFADIKQEIISTVDTTIVTVKISGIEPSNSTEIIVIKDPMRRLTLDKKLAVNDANELVVEYNIDLRLHKI